MTPESKVKKRVKDYLKAIGAYYFFPVQMGIGAATLDILCCIKGRFIGVEVKAEGKAPTARQLFTMNEIRRAGGIALWGDSYEQIVEKLKTAMGLP